MSSNLERSILTIIDPTIELDELVIADSESGTDDSSQPNTQISNSKIYNVLPLIRINNYEVNTDNLISFKLNNTGFYPTIKVIFKDNDTSFMGRFFPKDGDIIQLYIRSQGDETTFKPIRIDFTIIDTYPISGGGDTNATRFAVEGRMFVPNLFTERVEYHDATSWNALLDIAESLQLGYASNVEDTADQMTWINPNDTVDKYIQDIVANSYFDDDHFFTAYIDPYYYLTFIDVNRLFGQEGDIETTQGFTLNSMDSYGISEGQVDDFPNFLTNDVSFQGAANYMRKHQMVNESGLITKNNGYKRYAQFWDDVEREFISEFVDPLVEEAEDMQPATKGRLINGESEGPRDNQVRFKYLGQQSQNVHDQFMYSVVLNYQNLIEINKIGMVVELDTVNPSMLRYTRIYCKVYEYATPVKEQLTASTEDDREPPADEPRRSPESDEPVNGGILNEFLTGFYVISGIEWIQLVPGPMKMKLYLQRRVFKPTT
jgi:hypothetical protein